MIVKLLTEHHLEFLSLNEAAEARPSLHMSKWPHCCKSHAKAHIFNCIYRTCVSSEKQLGIMLVCSTHSLFF